MKLCIKVVAACSVSLSAPGLARAQPSGFELTWTTPDAGGQLTGNGFSLSFAIGQPDAETFSSGGLLLSGGYWCGSGAAPCYANCDDSTVMPVLTANDFQCFLNAFSGGLSYANCDGSTVPPELTANDFQCFLNAFSTGCP